METSKTLQNWNQVAEIQLIYKEKVLSRALYFCRGKHQIFNHRAQSQITKMSLFRI